MLAENTLIISSSLSKSSKDALGQSVMENVSDEPDYVFECFKSLEGKDLQLY